MTTRKICDLIKNEHAISELFDTEWIEPIKYYKILFATENFVIKKLYYSVLSNADR